MNTVIVKRTIRRMLLVQMLLALFFSALVAWWFGLLVGYSAGLGSVVFILPSLLFAEIAFRFHGASKAKNIVFSFYWGEALKIVVAVALFAIIFCTQRVSVLAFFIAYVVNQLAMVVILARL